MDLHLLTGKTARTFLLPSRQTSPRTHERQGPQTLSAHPPPSQQANATSSPGATRGLTVREDFIRETLATAVKVQMAMGTYIAPAEGGNGICTHSTIGRDTLASIRSHRLQLSTQFCSNRISLANMRGRNLASLARRHVFSSGRRSMSMASHNLPAGAWDSHIHILEPHKSVSNKATPGSAQYNIHEATLEMALQNAARLHVPNLVFVQPSPLGYDNSSQLDALARVTPSHGRAVVVCDANSTSRQQLEQWHKQGVRGVRLNLTSFGAEVSQDEFLAMIKKYADLIRPMGTWSLAVHMNLDLVKWLAPVLERPTVEEGGLGVKVVIDHMARPPSIQENMSELSGWSEFLKLVRNRNVYTKISAPYRLVANDPEFRKCEYAVRSLLDAAGGRNCLWASDWPHTRFDGLDISPWVARCLEWCDGDQSVSDMLFRQNAEELFDVQGRAADRPLEEGVRFDYGFDSDIANGDRNLLEL